MSEENKNESTNDDVVTLKKDEYNNLVGKIQHFEKTFSGIDPEKYKASIEELEIIKKQKATASKEDFEKHLKDVHSDYSTKIASFEQSIDSLKKENYELKVVDGVLNKIGTHFIDTEKAREVLKNEIRKSVQLENNGFKIIDDKGNTAYNKNGKALSLDEWVESLKQDFSFLVKDKVIAGGGTKGGNPSNATGKEPPAGLNQMQLTMWYAEQERLKKSQK